MDFINTSHKTSYPKVVSSAEETRSTMLEASLMLRQAVASTMGAGGKCVLIEDINAVGGFIVTKDGVTVANSISDKEPLKNTTINMMRQAARKTAVQAGDGTTTSIVLADAFFRYGHIHLPEAKNPMHAITLMRKVVDNVIEILGDDCVPVKDRAMIERVATISANNDETIGELIADAYTAAGDNGLVNLELSDEATTTFTHTQGFSFDKGMVDPMFGNMENGDFVAEMPKILVMDVELSNLMQIENLLKEVVQERKPLVIIGNVTTPVVQTLIANVKKNGLKFCVVATPSFGFRGHEIMEDIAIATGGVFVSERMGDDLSIIDQGYLGTAKKIIVSRHETTIVHGFGDKENIAHRVKKIELKLKDAEQKEQPYLRKRLASMSGGISMIHVGGVTELERKELYDRVEDAVLAVRSALREGIIAGSGIPLFKQGEYALSNIDKIKMTDDLRVASRIVALAIREPLLNIYANRGVTSLVDNLCALDALKKRKEGYDMTNFKKVDLLKAGIVDPLAVTKAALINSLSVATTMLMTDYSVMIEREE